MSTLQPPQVASCSKHTSSVSTVTDRFKCHWLSLTRARTESIISGLKLTVATNGDVWGGRPRSSALSLCATVTGLGAAQVAGGRRQQLGVVAMFLVRAVRRVLWGHEGRILLQSGEEEKWERWGCDSILDSLFLLYMWNRCSSIELQRLNKYFSCFNHPNTKMEIKKIALGNLWSKYIQTELTSYSDAVWGVLCTFLWAWTYLIF